MREPAERLSLARRHSVFLIRYGLCAVLVFPFLPASAQNLLTNPGFEQGGDRPVGWRLSGGTQGQWASPGHQGQRCLSLTGDGTNSFCWRSEDLALKPGGLYRLRFWGRRDGEVTGGCVTAGPSRVNHDFQFSDTWQPYSFVFVIPADGAADFIRLGQWEQKGTIYFDEVELVPLAAISTVCGNALELGEGESLEEGTYHCAINLGGPSGNYHRTLLESRCGFNSDRWTFAAAQQVTYAHSLGSSPFASARLKLALSYYAGGALRIEASDNGAAWVAAATLDEAHRGGEIQIPAKVLTTGNLFLRLTGEGPSCNLQVSGYELEAVLKQAVPDARGKTVLLETTETRPELAVHADNLQWAPEAGELRFAMSVTNMTSSALSFRAAVRLDGREGTPTATETLPAGGSRLVRIPVKPLRTGPQEAVLAIEHPRGNLLYFRGQTVVSLGLLQDPRPGYWLAQQPDLGLWWCESGWKIGREHGLPAKPKSGQPHPVTLSAARGEFVAAQVILNPRRPVELRGVSLRPRWLSQGRKADAITAEFLEVAYVKVKHPTDSSSEAGWYPDPLPPLRPPLKLVAGQCQPIWVSLHVDRSAPAGDYSGDLLLSTSAGDLLVPLKLHVYAFELPLDTHLKTALGLGSGDINRFHHLKTVADQRQVFDAYLTNFAQHRIAPYSFYDQAPIDVRFPGAGPDQHAAVDFTAFDREAAKWLGEFRFTTFMLPLRGMGGGTFQSRSLGELEGFKEGTPEHARLFKDYLNQVETHLRDRGWLGQAYTYWFDEPDAKDFQFVADGMQRIHAAAPGLRCMLTKEPHPELEGKVDIWCALTPQWTPEKVQARRAAGQEVWWYICCGPTAPYLTEFIDHPGTELRLWPWQSWQYGVQGLLIWATTYWTSESAFPPPKHQDPWTDPMSYVSGYDFKPGHIGYWGNGDGRFLYPPRAAAATNAPCLEPPVTSFRWENLRDGMQDYEYLWLLRQAIERNRTSNPRTTAVAAAEKLLNIPVEVSEDTRHFTTDPRRILEHRDRVARLIEDLSR